MAFRLSHPVLCMILPFVLGQQPDIEVPRSSMAAPAPAIPAIDPDARRSGVDESWWQKVREQIEREEYRASRTADGFQAPNRAQDLRTRFHSGGIEVTPRGQPGEDAEPWRWYWRTASVGRTNHMQAAGPMEAGPTAEGPRVIYARREFAEWYENRKEGLEQGFTVHIRPPGEGSLRLEGRLEGGLRAELRDEGTVDFVDEHGACVLRYAELHACDACGQVLPSHLVVFTDGLAILVDDQGADYPITIDPLMTSPAWTAESDQAGAHFGFSVGTAGDVNGDGFSDVIVGTPLYDNGELNEGRTFVYHGSATGLSVTPAWTAEGDQVDARFGWSVGTAGDVNGDGYSDIIVGSYSYDNGVIDEGRAVVYYGSSDGLSPFPAWAAESDQENALFGYTVGAAGDVNGDGFSDVIVGSHQYDNGQNNEGRAYVYLGSATGLGLSAAWTAEGNQDSGNFGYAVGSAGDVNGDGFSDVVVGAPLYDNGQVNEGRVFVYHGSPTGLSPSPAWTAESNQADAWFGSSVSMAGDVNGDGYSDVIVGAILYDNGQTDEGRVFTYYGSAVGLSSSPAWTAESDQASSQFSVSIGTAGDTNGDGFSDVIIGASNYGNGQPYEGRAYVYNGSSAGLSPSPAWTAESDQASAYFGVSVGTAGDVNGDGFSDVLVGVDGYENGQANEGRAYVYHGSAAGLAISAGWTAESDQANADFGWSLGTAGDVNGDGYSDVIVGAFGYDNGQLNEGGAFVFHGSAAGPSLIPAWTAEGDQAFALFGSSVGTAGDVNGDGYSDVIVGAYSYDNGQTDEGRAFVYHGSAPGLGLSPAWTAESNQATAQFGSSSGTAGDVNGDGYSDVIVGARLYDNGQDDEGRAFVYHGSATGLSLSPVWTAEGNQDGARFGYSVGTAGDVNGDGYSDVIVGAYLYDNGQTDEGRAVLYAGTASGLTISSTWTAESDQAGANFGYAVGTAGDVNGDGYSDVIVGAQAYDGGQVDEGRAYVYHGSVAGLSLSSSWSAESDQADARFGSSAATAGDVNGDGFSDIIVGAYQYDNGQTDEGRAYVYHGSATGLAPSAAWTAESNQADAVFGNPVGTAGDVNGDGFSDVIVGAFLYDGGHTDEGRAFVYYGNAGDGLDRIARQARTNDSAPIAILGLSDSGTGFRIKAFGRTPAGRGRVRLQREVKPVGVAFDGGGLITGPSVDTGAPVIITGSAVPLSELVGGLSPGNYHWRLRLVSDSPFFPRSPWFSLPGNAPSEADVRTAATSSGVAQSSPPAAHRWLEEGVPNPFTIATELAYTLPVRGPVRMAVYDVTGREVVVLADGVQDAGRHILAWDGRAAGGAELPDGVYVVRIELGGRIEARKIVLMK